MSTTPRADPAIYAKLRERALEFRLEDKSPDTVQAVLMDWHTGNGTLSVVAAVDGSASIYLSSGGGFIGGGQRYTELRRLAVDSVELARQGLARFEMTTSTELPPEGEVFFYANTGAGIRYARASEIALLNGTSRLASLGNAMQEIVTAYQLVYNRR
jgi:hypothetical protein